LVRSRAVVSMSAILSVSGMCPTLMKCLGCTCLVQHEFVSLEAVKLAPCESPMTLLDILTSHDDPIALHSFQEHEVLELLKRLEVLDSGAVRQYTCDILTGGVDTMCWCKTGVSAIVLRFPFGGSEARALRINIDPAGHSYLTRRSHYVATAVSSSAIDRNCHNVIKCARVYSQLRQLSILHSINAK
jgi:hypothetical protein